MSQAALSANLVDVILAKRSITAEDVLKLRREVFRDNVVDLNEAEAVFQLDQGCQDKDPSWTQFYVDALTDFFVWQAKPRGYVDEDAARYLIDNLACDGRIDGMSELELLINVVHWAASCPEELADFAMKAVRESVLSPETAAYGSNRPPAVISPLDVAIIRKLIYAPSSPGGFNVTRGEAELIYELHDACAAAENAPAWDDLFVKAIANYLMFPRGAPVVLSADEVKRRERWLQERRGVGQLLADISKAAATGNIDFKGAYEEVDPFGKEKARKENEREAARVREALTREAIDADEARWLTSHIMRDGALRDTERTLLEFIKNNSPGIDPALDALFAKAGI